MAEERELITRIPDDEGSPPTPMGPESARARARKENTSAHEPCSSGQRILLSFLDTLNKTTTVTCIATSRTVYGQ